MAPDQKTSESEEHTTWRLPLPHRLGRLLPRQPGSKSPYRLIVAAILGAAAGYGTLLFKFLIDGIHRVVFLSVRGGKALPRWRIVLSPAAGGLIVGPLIHFFAREAKGPGIAAVKDACAHKGGRIRPRVALVKALSSGVCIGTGGSAGREGPIVQIGGSLGSFFGQILAVRGTYLVDMVASGAAAGIAATFNAPLAGVIFALEVILGRSSPRHFSPLIVSSVVATVIARHHLADVPAFTAPPHSMVSAWELPLYVLLGVLAALVGVAFTRGLYLVESLWERLPAPFLHAAFGGAIVGLIGLWYPQVFGVGYELIEQVLGESIEPATRGLLLLLLAKTVATIMTIGSGGSGGIFAPSLFLGATLGGAFGRLTNQLMPTGTAGQGAYALVAMGAVLSATTHAPLSAILTVFEITDSYRIILPLMLCCILATMLAMRLCRESIYTLGLARRGRLVGASRDETDALRKTQAGTLMAPAGTTVRPSASLLTLLERAIAADERCVYVTDRKRHLLGVITMEDVAIHARDSERERDRLTAKDLMHHSFCTITTDTPLSACLPQLSNHHWEELPVVDPDGRLIGRLTRDDMMTFLSHEVLQRDAVLSFASDDDDDDGNPLETLRLASGEVKAQVPVGGELVGQTLAELNLRVRFGINVYAVRDVDGHSAVPDSTAPLVAGDVLVVVGPEHEVDHLRDIASK